MSRGRPVQPPQTDVTRLAALQGDYTVVARAKGRALAVGFGMQWLQLQKLEAARPEIAAVAAEFFAPERQALQHDAVARRADRSGEV